MEQLASSRTRARRNRRRRHRRTDDRLAAARRGHCGDDLRVVVARRRPDAFGAFLLERAPAYRVVRRDGRLDAPDDSRSGETFSARIARHVFRPAAALSRYMLPRRPLLLDGRRRSRLRENLPHPAGAARRNRSNDDVQDRDANGAAHRCNEHARLDRALRSRRNELAARTADQSFVRQRVWARRRRAERAEFGHAARGATPLCGRPRDERARLLRPAVHLGQREPVASRSNCGVVAGRQRDTQLPAAGNPAYAQGHVRTAL